MIDSTSTSVSYSLSPNGPSPSPNLDMDGTDESSITSESSESKDKDKPSDDLTSLTWLQNINILTVPGPPTPPASPKPGKKSHRIPVLKEHEIQEYKTTRTEKPPFSYANLICMAMRANKGKMTLSSIYSWIKESFVYYRMADPSWQNSIRHNLSLNRCFMKVARSKDEPGKGGFWRLDPAFDRGERPYRLRKRRNPPKNKKPKNNPNSTANIVANAMKQSGLQIHSCSDLNCPETHPPYVAQEMEIPIIQHVQVQPQVNANVSYSPQTVGSSEPLVNVNVNNVTLLQNVELINPLQSQDQNQSTGVGKYVELTSAERIFNENGECVYVFCTADQSSDDNNGYHHNQYQIPDPVVPVSISVSEGQSQYNNGESTELTPLTNAIEMSSLTGPENNNNINQSNNDIVWDERCSNGCPFFETELDLEELIRNGEL